MKNKLKKNTVYACSKCGAQSPKWLGRCLECGAWGTLAPEIKQAPDRRQITAGQVGELTDFGSIEGKEVERFKTNLAELDRVLGGGLVPGSLVLMTGEPGIGKSTLVLQMINLLDAETIYVSGEESPEQIKLRADRIGLKSGNLKFLSETNIDNIIATLDKAKPKLAIIDSIQTIFWEDLPSEAGSQGQVRVCTVKLLELAKKNNITIIIIGHVTKEGVLAGPKSMEHLVDAVLYLEGDKYHAFRILRSTKNRFGSTNEVGVFDMRAEGLIEVKNPSEVFLAERQKSAGSCVAAILEGSRSFLVEIQALVNTTVFGLPRRTANGVDYNRLQMIIAVLAKRCGLSLGNQDIYVNVVGGFKVTEPAVDLAVALAIASAFKNKIIPEKTVVLGEIGLGGEIRTVSQIDKRLNEIEKMGFNKVILSANAKIGQSKLNLVRVKNLPEAIKEVFGY
ncbi:MAG: DNA repair protein RadA [Patescibacteria group bacterium]